MLRLPREVSQIWQDWLAEAYPDRAAKIMARLREMHGGRDYDPRDRTHNRNERLDICSCGHRLRDG